MSERMRGEGKTGNGIKKKMEEKEREKNVIGEETLP